MPDLNSIPSSPSRSRRPTGTSINILPSNQQAVNNATSTLSSAAPPSSPGAAMSPTSAHAHDSSAAVPAGPGPIRHPRPLTAAELHSELEQEQELLVNRLTRDLTMLRAAHNSSVVSNTSSASAAASTTDQHPFTDTHMLSGPGFHIPATNSADRRHHRTSSSTSARSFSQSGTAPIPIAHHHHSGSAAVLEAARNPRGAASSSMSRQNSTASHRSRSRNHSPGPSSYTHSHMLPSSSSYGAGDFPTGYFRGAPTASGPASNTSVAAAPGSDIVMSPGLMPATYRYEETAFYRSELESAKRENDGLKRRVKELERMLRGQTRRETSSTRQQQQPQAGDQMPAAGTAAAESPRERTESMSTTASAVSVSGMTGVSGGGGGGGGGGVGIAPSRHGIERAQSSVSFAGSVAIGVPEEEVKVGESAASSAGTRKESTASAIGAADAGTAASAAAGAGTEAAESTNTQ
ncbi:hypothetical protein MN608_07389 [Microdochium nivale]|nr:hypothetical protein MN608_07389 [Microdochium nivale]